MAHGAGLTRPYPCLPEEPEPGPRRYNVRSVQSGASFCFKRGPSPREGERERKQICELGRVSLRPARTFKFSVLMRMRERGPSGPPLPGATNGGPAPAAPPGPGGDARGAGPRAGIAGAGDVGLGVPAAPRSPGMSPLFVAAPLGSTASPERDGAFRLLRTRLNEIRQCCKAHETSTAALSE